MDIKTFMNLYKEFLLQCEQKGWLVEVLVKKFGNHLAAITSQEGIEVQFFFELDLENVEKLTEKTNQSILKYGVIRQKGKGDIFGKEVLEHFTMERMAREVWELYGKVTLAANDPGA